MTPKPLFDADTKINHAVLISFYTYKENLFAVEPIQNSNH